MKQLDDILRQNKAFKTLLNGKGNIIVNDINDEALLISSAFLTLKKDIVVVKPNQYEANMLYQQIMSINEHDTLLFPVDESYRIEALAASPELLGQRIDTLYQLTTDKPKILITHSQALVRYLPAKQIFKENCLDLKVGMQIDIYDLQKYLLKEYCVSIGIRDVKKAMQRICSSKLVKINNAKIKEIDISQEDIDQYLDKKINNENFLNYAIPGVSKALAVSGNTGSCFPIETVLLEGNGKVEITGLPKDSAIESVKIALTNVKKLYPKLLLNKDIHVHFGQGAIVKDGPSAGVALFMSILSATINKPLMNNKPNDIGYTGEISLTGGVFPVGGLTSKIQAAIDSGCTKVFIPQENYNLLDKNKLNKYECSIIPVSHLSQIINEIYPELKLGVCMLNI